MQRPVVKLVLPNWIGFFLPLLQKCTRVITLLCSAYRCLYPCQLDALLHLLTGRGVCGTLDEPTCRCHVHDVIAICCTIQLNSYIIINIADQIRAIRWMTNRAIFWSQLGHVEVKNCLKLRNPREEKNI